MISFIFIISFLLHIITIFAIYQLYKQILVLKQENTGDIIELFDTYLQEIKDENRRLQAELGEKTSQEQFNTPHLQENVNKKQTTAAESSQYNAYTLPDNNIDDSVEASLQARILQLYKQGYSETEIAQKLNCGKTEAALIIKLHA